MYSHYRLWCLASSQWTDTDTTYIKRYWNSDSLLLGCKYVSSHRKWSCIVPMISCWRLKSWGKCTPYSKIAGKGKQNFFFYPSFSFSFLRHFQRMWVQQPRLSICLCLPTALGPHFLPRDLLLLCIIFPNQIWLLFSSHIMSNWNIVRLCWA